MKLKTAHFFQFRKKLTHIAQESTDECSIACLTMISNFYGRETSLRQLRNRYNTSLQGTTLLKLKKMAVNEGFHARPLKLNASLLEQVQKPAILHWDNNHFVVLDSVKSGQWVIYDPSTGIHKLNQIEVEQHFNGIVLELVPRKDFVKEISREKVRLQQVTGRLSGLIPSALSILCISLFIELITLLGPYYLQWILDRVITTSDFNLLNTLALGFLILAFVAPVINAIRSWIMIKISSLTSISWSRNVIFHLVHLPLDWYERRGVGDVVSKIKSIDGIQQSISGNFLSTLLDGAMSLLIILVMFVYSPSITAILTSLVTFYFLVRILYLRSILPMQTRALSCHAEMDGEIIETIRGSATVKTTRIEVTKTSRYINKAIAYANASIDIQKLELLMKGFNQILFGVYRVWVIWTCSNEVLNNSMSTGVMVAFVTYSELFTNRMLSFIEQFIELKMLAVHVERLSDITLSQRESEFVGESTRNSEGNSLTVENLSFSYSDIENPIIDELSFSIDAGESVAITGPSGSGKSTLARMIAGLIPPHRGAIKLGGVDIRELGTKTYRGLIGTVLQDDVLFSGTLAQNIASFDEEMDIHRVVEVAKLANIHHEIERMPMRYDSLIGDMGSILSGGQKQRVLLARALYPNPRILLLDEATSHLDIENERLINQMISNLKMTRIIIAHRKETIESAVRVIAMQHL